VRRDLDRAFVLRVEALATIERNKVASTPAQLVLGEALANLGRTEEAIQALKIFLQEAPDNPVKRGNEVAHLCRQGGWLLRLLTGRLRR
jgi:predicted Zn-dependent protease